MVPAAGKCKGAKSPNLSLVAQRAYWLNSKVLMSDIFITQPLFDDWNGHDSVELEGDRMRTRAVDIDFWLVQPAVYFQAVDGDCEDKYNLVGLVKTAQQLAQIQAEQYMTSVVLQETAYTVVTGFVLSARNRADQEVELTKRVCQQLAQLMPEDSSVGNDRTS